MRCKKLGSILLIFLLLSFLPACQKEKTLLEEQKEVIQKLLKNSQDEMIVAVNVDGSSTELPFESVWMNRSKFWGGLIFQGLLIADETITNVSPDLCEEYIISTDGMKYTFILKENLNWHDGKPLTTEDVVWSIETCLKVQETNGFVKKGLQAIQGTEEFEKGMTTSITGINVRENDITITLRENDANFLAAITQLAILPKHCFEGIEIDKISSSEFWKMPIGSGPYKVITNVDNKEAVLVVNEDYSNKIPKIKQIRYKVLENAGMDKFDFTLSSDPVTVANFRKNPRYNVVKTNNLYYRYLIFNLDKRTGENAGLLDDSQVRKALMLAIDKDRILKEIYDGAAESIDSGISSEDSWYVMKEKSEVEYNPALAKHMLESAEFDFSKTIVLTRYSLDELSKRLLENIAECWRDIGIKVEIIPIESDSTNKLFVEADWYDVALKNLSAVDYTEWYFEYSSENQLWSEILNNRKEFDTLINHIDHLAYADELRMYYEELQQLENNLVYKIPIAIVPQYVIYNKQHLYIPEQDFPNLWYYFDLKLEDWSIIE